MIASISPEDAASSTPTISAHDKNVSMLFDKLNELKTVTENVADASIFYQVEREYSSVKK